MTLEQDLAALGTFQNEHIAVISMKDIPEAVLSFCVGNATEVLLFSRRPMKQPLGNVQYFCLEDSTGTNRWSNLQRIPVVIVCSLSGLLFQEVLFAVARFCRVIIVGPIDGVIANMDFYSTVHAKNLELIFLPLTAHDR